MNSIRQFVISVLVVAFHLQLCGQSVPDSVARPKSDSIKTAPLKLQLFSAKDPTQRIQLDTQISLLPELNEFGLALPNAYTIRYYHFDQSYNSRIFQHGQNSISQKRAYAENYEFILPNQAYTEIQTNRWRALSNSQAGFQDNFDISLIFASAFRNNITWNFSYDRQIYKGIYSHEKQRNTLFTTGLHFGSQNGNVQTSLIYTDEGHYLEHNWGIQSDTFLTNPQFSVRESVPVNHQSPLTESSGRNIQLNNSIRLKKDSSRAFSSIHLRSTLSRYTSSYLDPDNRGIDSLYFSYAVDSIINLNAEEDHWQNILSFPLLAGYRQKLDLNLKHEWQSFKTGLAENTRTAVSLGFKHRYAINTELVLETEGGYSFSDEINYPEFRILADYKKANRLSAQMNLFHVQRPVPNMYSSINLNDSISIPAAINNRDYTINGLSLLLNHHSLLKPYFHIEYKNYNRYFYLGRDALLSEISKTNILQLKAGMELRSGIWEGKISCVYHKMEPDSIGVNGWLVHSQFGIASPLFRNKVFTKLGLKSSYADYSGSPGYFPLLQQFYFTGKAGKPIYTLGVYAHFKVKDFQFNLDLDQLDSFWEKNRVGFFQGYPIYDFMLRMAISWRFLN
ncbi:MAG: hypothetical protein IPM34_07290 [Saprospiraceae bacterium]|nr:hypothetical protein [Saprospiraceae bacterium]